MGTLTLTEKGRIEVGTDGQGHGGTVEVQVGRLTLTDGASISASTEGPGQRGLLTVMADEAIVIAGRSGPDEPSRLSVNASSRGNAGSIVISAPIVSLSEGAAIRARTSGAGNGGAIKVQAGRLTLTGGSQISGRTDGSGQAGTVTVTATEAITLAGRVPGGARSGLSALSDGRAAAGRIVVTAPTVSLAQEGEITAEAISSVSGDAGTIELRVGTLTLTEGSRITVRNFGPGQGGLLAIMADEAIVIARPGPTEWSLLSSSTRGAGAGGRMRITTPRLTIRDGGLLRADTTGAGNAGTIELQVGTLTNGGTITTSTSGSGQGGPLTITAREAIVIAGHHQDATPSRLVSTTEGPGPGGNLQIVAQHIELRDGGTIAASSSGTGPAGTLLLQAGETFRSERGAVTMEATQAGGGTIALRAGRLVQLTNSQLTTSVRGGGGDAGNLTLDAPLVVAEGSQIIANAFGGRGG